jgi:radical SAM superfamily enzyme YgiQ (UPF0313 family)
LPVTPSDIPAAGSPPILLLTINAKWIHPSLALRLLKANLGGLEDQCEILEFALRQPLAEKLEMLRPRRPRILGISVSIWNHAATVELLEALERIPACPGAPARPLVVLGGPEVSYLPPDAEIFRHADYVIRGEGEIPFRELCGALLSGPGGQPALAAGPQLGGSRPFGGPPPGGPRFIDAAPAELGALRPAYSYYSGEDLARKLVYVESSRGCPFRCEFCMPQGPARPGVREFYLEDFLAEMETLIRRGARNFKFLDRSFNYDSKRAIRIMEFFLRHIQVEAGFGGPPARPLCVHFEMVPGSFPAELRDLLRRFPPLSLRLEIGIQTLNPQTAALIGRAGDGEAALEVLSFLSGETGAIVHADLIAGLPGEDLDSFARGFDRLWLALSGPVRQAQDAQGQQAQGQDPFTAPDRRVEIQLGILKLLPGAAIARHSTAQAMRYNPAPPYEVISTAALPRSDLDRIKNFARFWEILINRRPFPELPLAPPGRPVFWSFMKLSGRLLERFGRNWGIDRRDLRAAVEAETEARCSRIGS